MGGLRKLYSNSMVYALGSIASKAIGFLMIPVYTRCLTPADYGTIELIYRATDVIALIAAMGLAPAVMRFYFDYRDQRDRNEVVSSGLIIMAIGGLLLATIACIFRDQFSYLIFGHPGHALLVQLALISMLLELVVMVPMSYVQAEQRAFLFTGIGLGKLLVGLAMNIWLIVYVRMGVLGVAWSAAASGAMAAFLVVPLVIRHTGIHFSWPKSLEMFRYGLPLVPGQIGMFILSFADRFILEHYSGVSEVGIYSLGFKFGVLVTLLVSEPFLRAWLPYALSIAHSEDYKRAYPDTLRHFAIAAVGFALAVSLMSRDVIGVMAAPSFHDAYVIVPIIGFAHAVRSLAFQLEIGILVSKRTIYRIVTVGSSAAAYVLLCLLLIPRYGALGAAWSTALSCGFFALASYVVSNRFLPVHYDFRRVAGTLALGVAIYAASTFIHLHNHLVSAGVKSGFLLCYPVGLFISGIWERSEVSSIKNRMLQLRRSLAWKGC